MADEKKKEIEAPSERKWSWMLSGWFYLKKSNRREDRPNQTDHLRLQVAVKRGTLLSTPHTLCFAKIPPQKVEYERCDSGSIFF